MLGAWQVRPDADRRARWFSITADLKDFKLPSHLAAMDQSSSLIIG
jgi:hypothetical protein